MPAGTVLILFFPMKCSLVQSAAAFNNKRINKAIDEIQLLLFLGFRLSSRSF